MLLNNNLKYLLFVLFILYKPCHSIKCYQCNSLLNAGCNNDSLNNNLLRKCPDMYNYCRKITSTYFFKKPTQHVIRRECAIFMSEDKGCYKGRQFQGSTQYICECKDHDGCNKAEVTSYYSFIIIISIQLLLVFVK